MLDLFKHHCINLKLKKCQYFSKIVYLGGGDIKLGGNQPAQYRFAYFDILKCPCTWEYLWMLIGLFGFYIKFIPLYIMDIRSWIDIMAKYPRPGPVAANEERNSMLQLCTSEDKSLLEILKSDILLVIC